MPVLNQSLSFDGDNTRRCLNVSTTEDELLEGEENFMLDLDTDDPSIVLAPEEAEVRINDADRKCLAF